MPNQERRDHKKQGFFPEWFSLRQKDLSKHDDKMHVIGEVLLFKDLRRRDRREVVNLFHVRNFARGEIIFETGTPGMGMYIIVEGSVRIEGSEESNNIVLAELDEADFFGEMSLIDETPRSATATAIVPTQAIVIFRTNLRDLMNRKPKLGLILLRRLASIIAYRLREANRQLSESRLKEKKNGKN